ncbi:Hypothetical predicted protein [Cloeon dipterum]|uniref:Uncharacterized protein n=1 Tax=Cloeon dipterum TaxID=197152 RepID=A0A8S1DNN0_9INSE|nr:Hypothetical predicted protein [Cloeon dipterum]
MKDSSGRQADRYDVVWCGLTKDNIPIHVARTLHLGYYVPGYAVGDVGYFVSKELQEFQTCNFQVLVGTFIEFVKFPLNDERDSMVADDNADESKRIKIGSFVIKGARYCGMVETNNTCHINFDDQIYSKKAPAFQVVMRNDFRRKRS